MQASSHHATQNQAALHPGGGGGGGGGVTDFLAHNLKRVRTRLENNRGAADCGISAGSIPTAQMALLCGLGCCFFPPSPSSAAFIERSGISLANDKRRQTEGKRRNGNVPCH